MKVKDLIHSLSSLNPDLEVILQKDREGNGYSPLHNYQCDSYIAKNPWSGDLTESADEGGIPCVVLYPIN